MRVLFLALVLSGCGGPFDPPLCDSGRAADAGAADLAPPTDLGPFMCGVGGGLLCPGTDVCVSGDCVPGCWFYDGGCTE